MTCHKSCHMSHVWYIKAEEVVGLGAVVCTVLWVGTVWSIYSLSKSLEQFGHKTKIKLKNFLKWEREMRERAFMSHVTCMIIWDSRWYNWTYYDQLLGWSNLFLNVNDKHLGYVNKAIVKGLYQEDCVVELLNLLIRLTDLLSRLTTVDQQHYYSKVKIN